MFPTWRNHPPACLARTVPSLARTVLKPSVLPQRGTRRQRQLVLTDGMDGMDGMGWIYLRQLGTLEHLAVLKNINFSI